MRMFKLSLFVLVAFALGMVLSACSKPPEAEKEAAGRQWTLLSRLARISMPPLT